MVKKMYVSEFDNYSCCIIVLRPDYKLAYGRQYRK